MTSITSEDSTGLTVGDSLITALEGSRASSLNGGRQLAVRRP